MGELEARLTDAEKERDCLQRQLAASLPQVKIPKKGRRINYYFSFTYWHV
jgi:hypothetical protein